MHAVFDKVRADERKEVVKRAQELFAVGCPKTRKPPRLSKRDKGAKRSSTTKASAEIGWLARRRSTVMAATKLPKTHNLVGAGHVATALPKTHNLVGPGMWELLCPGFTNLWGPGVWELLCPGLTTLWGPRVWDPPSCRKVLGESSGSAWPSNNNKKRERAEETFPDK